MFLVLTGYLGSGRVGFSQVWADKLMALATTVIDFFLVINATVGA